MQEQEINILEARFNPIVKTYIFLYVAGILFMSVIGWPILIVWLLGFGQWYSKLYYEKLECVLSSRTLRFKKGIIFQIEKTIPLENIQDITFIEGPLLRYFNLCILKIETAGQQSGQYQANHMQLIGIEYAENFRYLTLEQRRKLINQSKETESHKILIDIKSILEKIDAKLN